MNYTFYNNIEIPDISPTLDDQIWIYIQNCTQNKIPDSIIMQIRF